MATFVQNQLQPYAALTNFVKNKPLLGKTFLITGAGRGVGEHITREIAAAGAKRIGMIGRDKARIDGTRDRLAASYRDTEFVSFAADITDETAITNVFVTFGVPDVLINNAGHFPDDGPFVSQDLKQWWTGFEINVLGTAIVTQKFLQARPDSQPATILNVSSIAAHMRFPFTAWSGYNSSKAASARIFEYLRFEHLDVKFINIHPGQIESDGFIRSGAPPPPGGMTDGEMAGQFYAWAASSESDGLSGRFLWAQWDIEELKAKKAEILDKDLLLLTIDGFDKGF